MQEVTGPAARWVAAVVLACIFALCASVYLARTTSHVVQDIAAPTDPLTWTR